MSRSIRTLGVAALAGAGLAMAGTAVAKSMDCAAVTDAEIAALFDRWNASLGTGSPDAVTANYARDAVLLPTVSNTPRTDHALIRDYFVTFLQKKPVGTIDTRTITIGCNMASDVGTYTFALTDEAGKVNNVAARYSYVYALENGQWLIKHHHSSAMPE